MSKTRIGKPFVRGGKVVAYVYKDGKKTARSLMRITHLTPKDLRKGVKPALVAFAMAEALKYAVIAAFEL